MEPTLLRILDANLNRAREGLRVLEEHARMVLDDEAMTATVKSLRHELQRVARAIGERRLLAARDIQNDVGTRISIDSERVRRGVDEVAAAAAKRAGEALRCLEEYLKAVQPAEAAAVEQLRYRLYAIEQDALLGAPLRRRLRDARLHVLVTESLCARPWWDVCERVIDGGADVIQLREKSLTDRELLGRAARLRELTSRAGVLLIINDRADIARIVCADGVHVGQTDLPVEDARVIVGRQALVGVSTHSPEEAAEALRQAPDYVAAGPLFSSTTKPAVAVQGPALLNSLAGQAAVPLVAIGGITADRLAQTPLPPGVQIAVCQAVIGSPDPRQAAEVLKRSMSDKR